MQDTGIEYESDTTSEKIILYPTPKVRELLELFEEYGREQAKRARSEHAKSFWGRAGENVARVGGTIRAMELFEGETSDHSWDEHDLEQAAAIIMWHGEMLDAHTESNEDTEMSELAAIVVGALSQGVRWRDNNPKAPYPDGLTIPMLSWLQSGNIPGARRLRGNSRLKEAVIGLWNGTATSPRSTAAVAATP